MKAVRWQQLGRVSLSLFLSLSTSGSLGIKMNVQAQCLCDRGCHRLNLSKRFCQIDCGRHKQKVGIESKCGGQNERDGEEIYRFTDKKGTATLEVEDGRGSSSRLTARASERACWRWRPWDPMVAIGGGGDGVV